MSSVEADVLVSGFWESRVDEPKSSHISAPS